MSISTPRPAQSSSWSLTGQSDDSVRLQMGKAAQTVQIKQPRSPAFRRQRKAAYPERVGGINSADWTAG